MAEEIKMVEASSMKLHSTNTIFEVVKAMHNLQLKPKCISLNMFYSDCFGTRHRHSFEQAKI